jgi:hypothetical protein
MKALFLMIVFVLAFSVVAQQDTTQQGYEYTNVKGGVELPAIEVQPNKGAWQKAKKHIYKGDTVKALVTTTHTTASGLGKDTVMNTIIYIVTGKCDSLPTGDSLGGKPCYQTRSLRNTVWVFGFINDTSVLKR